ncbi:MAG: ATP phosphoribosyltransferase [Chloroflexi bacterium]|nr:MAG: ATP phosphoribosyltransferase [Chloroflexota bacterium]
MTDNRTRHNLRLAIQKEGRLTQQTMSLLHTAGLEFESYRAQLFVTCRNFDLDVLYVRDDDIPEYVAEGVVDLGIVGQNLVTEYGFDVRDLHPLGFGYCKLVVAVVDESDVLASHQLEGGKVATSYPNSARRYFDSLGINVTLIPVRGSVELAPAIGVATAVVELTATGGTLRINDLRVVDTILSSEATLVANPLSYGEPIRRREIDRLLVRLRAVLNAKTHKYVMMNVPREALERVQQVAPGMKSPTVVPLADPDWVAVHAAVREELFWDVIEALRSAGATEILVSPIEKLIM